MSGPELHMQALNAAMNGEFLQESSALLDGTLVILAALAAWSLSLLVRAPAARLVIMVVVIGTYAALLLFVFNNFGLLLPLATPAGVFVLGTLQSVLCDFLRVRREKARFRGMLDRYVSPEVVQELIDNPESFLHSLRGVRKPVTALFADLRGFTGMIENRDATELIGQLNEYYEAMTRHVFENSGVLDKIMGDAIMAVWGGIHSQGLGLDAASAVRAAFQMKQTLAVLNEDWRARGLPAFAMGLGLNCGQAVVGNIGSQRKMDPTAIGECVNLAARFEEMTKEYSVDILIGQDLAELVRPLFYLQSVDRVKVKGSNRLIEVFTVCGELQHGLEPSATEYFNAYAEGLDSLKARDFAKAKTLLLKCLELRPDDSLAGLHLRRCAILSKLRTNSRGLARYVRQEPTSFADSAQNLEGKLWYDRC